ncbi:MAG: hypothetical protein O2791_02480, partial [Bacteroidetes bacterium]|nr:hypothetical protein [Bacteroidota bacterium]
LPPSLAAEIMAQIPEVEAVEVGKHLRSRRNGSGSAMPWVRVELNVPDSALGARKIAVEQQLRSWLLLRLDVDSMHLDLVSP